MALFGGQRDMSLFRSLNRELINDIVDTKVDIIKSAIKDMKENLYGEALGKQYFQNVRVGCLIEQGDTEIEDTEFGPDVNKIVTFKFLRDDIKEIANVKLEIGDLLFWDNSYWEIDKVSSGNQYNMGRNPSSNFAGDDHGYNLAVICETHMTRKSNLSVEQTNTGYNKDIY
mgnify:CR=1 FL=1|tara:strand:+ start:1573 stop:2085 length:513 start_codon:yes stop_codon:yes gene_type:complete